jgi:DNA-directed RNA polymerase specialized sigma24 family protein
MDWVSDAASKRQFEVFAAAASDSLLRTGYLMTGDVRDAEDLVQETFLRWPGGGTGCGRWIIRPPTPAVS